MDAVNVKDLNAAEVAAKQLQDANTILQDLVGTLKKSAEDMRALDKTMGLSDQFAQTMDEMAVAVSNLVPGLSQAGDQLQATVQQAKTFEELAKKNVLGNC